MSPDSALIVLSGAGAAGTAILRLLRAAGARNVLVTDIDGIVHEGREQLTGRLPWIAEVTNPGGLSGTLHEAVAGADVRSEEHTSELQSRGHLVCRLLLEKKK